MKYLIFKNKYIVNVYITLWFKRVIKKQKKFFLY